MTFPVVPKPEETARHFCAALKKSAVLEKPYRRWILENTIPESMAVGILVLPVKPPFIDECGGVRDLYDNNSKRYFFTPKAQEDFPAVKEFCEAFQRPEVARQFAETLGHKPETLEGSFLRIEYIQDTDGAWLEPHPDVPSKLFSMVIYLCTGPEAKGWGTDIYDENKKWLERGPADFNRAVIFVRSDTTFHGYEKRPIIGVRRLMEVNYVRPDWRDRDQLCFPDRPITLVG
ncbi:MAG: 2OG-Fe(II) oxygenase [Alphaproteobacteria bacterium]|nr:2OG-Fe(II) oxygenase [Alphaproteobacteria bacterium]